MLNSKNLRPFPVSESDNWALSMREAFKTSEELCAYLNCANEGNSSYPVFVPSSLAKKIKAAGKSSPLWEQFVPGAREFDPQGYYDPIGDGIHSKGHGIIHRYKNRVLFSPVTVCPVNCRYCFRKNELAQKDPALKGRLEKLISYLDRNPQVNEVILTGGDPLILSDSKMEILIEALAGKVKYLRFHTRTPVILPERITARFLELMRLACQEFVVVSMAIHANHKDEFDDKNNLAIARLNGTGIQLLSQSVLLKDVNNNLKSLVELYEHFAKIGVKSYYLHHPDKVKGAMHFHLPLPEGRKLYAALRDELPGWAIPHYVIDPENGQGKNLAYNPESLEFSGRLLDRFGNLASLER